jgi:hypothetical protein
VTGQWFSPGPPVSSTNKTDLYDITEILLKVVLNIIILLYNMDAKTTVQTNILDKTNEITLAFVWSFIECTCIL